MAERVILPKNVIPVHYSLTLTPNLVLLDYDGEESIDVIVSKSAGNSVSLHSKEIHIKEVTFKSNSDSNLELKLNQISYDLKLNTVTFTFDNDFPEGTGILTIKFKGILNGDMAGFYKSNYTDAMGNKKIMASTQFEALDARRAFPCWDEPAMKATFAVTMIVDAHLTCISNMPELSVMHLPQQKPGDGPKKKIIFDVSPKMSTYLLAWAVGEFDFVQAVTKNGVVIRVLSPPGRAEQGKFALDCGVRSLDFYDEFFNVPYPLPKLDMICITEFAMGAMENWGLVTYRETALMIDEEKASSQAKQRVAIVVAHELAHQWFGNLVTMGWWDGLWLNEGFAAFMEHFCIDALYPDYKIWEQYTTDAMGAAQRLDSLRSSHPIIVPIKHAEEVEQVFDAISYCKGSTVVNMVYALLGYEKFKLGLQNYMKKHAYGNTETNDLWQAWSDVSGMDIAKLMKTWTTRMGYPYLSVVDEKWSSTEVEFTLKQAWFLADGSSQPGDDDAIWSVPLLFETGKGVSPQAVIMDQKEMKFKVPLAGADDWLKINAGQKALVRVAVSSEMAGRLNKAIKSNALSAIDRAALLLDSYSLARAGLVNVQSVIEILTAFVDEGSSIVWGAISGVLNGLYLLMEALGGNPFEEFKQFGKLLVTRALAKVGWDSSPNDGHTDKLMRSTIIGLLDTFAYNDPTVAAEARRRFDAHWENPSVLPGEYKTTVYRIVLTNGGDKEYEAILKTYYATEDNSERKYAVGSLGSALSEQLKLRTLDWAVKSGDVKLQDFFYPIGAVASNAAGAQLAWTYYQNNFNTIKSMLAKASPSLMDAVIVNCINRFCTVERANEIEKFFEANPLPSSARRISQSVEMIRSNSNLLANIKKSSLSTDGYWKKYC